MLAEYVSPAGRRACAGEEGLTLVEIMIAAFLLSIAILALASVATASLVSVRDSRERDRATAGASSAIEAARSLTFDQVALRDGGDWDDDPLLDEVQGDVIASAGGQIDPYLCTSESADCWFDMPAGTGVEVRTFVSTYEDLGAHFARRVTVIATWAEPGMTGPRTVRMTTVISHADRGLPAPRFELFPTSLYTGVDEFFLDQDDPEDGWYCFQHVITNLGIPDRYEIHLPLAENWKPVWLEPGFGAAQNQYYNDSGDDLPWRFRAYFVPTGEAIGADTIMQPVSPTETDRIVSQATLDTEESADLFACYRSRTHFFAPSAPNLYEITHELRSSFDPNISETLEHDIEVSTLLTLYLHYAEIVPVDPLVPEGDLRWDQPQTVDGHFTRPADHDGTFFIFDRLPLKPESHSPPDFTMPRYDQQIHYDGQNYNHSADRLPRAGMLLPRASVDLPGGAPPPDGPTPTSHSPAQLAVEWEYQFTDETAPVTYQGGVQLTGLYSIGPTGAEAPPPAQRRCIRTELWIVPSGGGAPTLVGALDRNFEPGGGGWQPVTDPAYSIPWSPETITFEPGDVLRLRLANTAPAASGLTCTRFHLGFGVEDRPAALRFTPGGPG